MIFTFIPTADNDQTFAFQERVIGRGITLAKDGYTLVHRDEIPGTYYVHSPEGKCYIVDVRGKFTSDNCQCGCYVKNGYCKHMVACAIEEDRKYEESQIADLEVYARRNGWTD